MGGGGVPQMSTLLNKYVQILLSKAVNQEGRGVKKTQKLFNVIYERPLGVSLREMAWKKGAVSS